MLVFSLEGVPEPLEPSVGTVEFDADARPRSARAIVRAGARARAGHARATRRRPTSSGERFEEVASGTVAEQRFEAAVDGEDVELRNVLLTLPGTSDRAILIVAERDSREGPGAATSAAATGVLLELARALGVSGRERTLILASTDGAGAEAEGARELIEALPERTVVDAAVVISSPGRAGPPSRTS